MYSDAFDLKEIKSGAVFLYFDNFNSIKCVKLCLTKLAEMKTKTQIIKKMSSMNIHLSSDIFAFNEYCIWQLLYMTVTTIKRCTTNCFPVKFYGFFVVFSYIQ